MQNNINNKDTGCLREDQKVVQSMQSQNPPNPKKPTPHEKGNKENLINIQMETKVKYPSEKIGRETLHFCPFCSK